MGAPTTKLPTKFSFTREEMEAAAGELWRDDPLPPKSALDEAFGEPVPDEYYDWTECLQQGYNAEVVSRKFYKKTSEFTGEISRLIKALDATIAAYEREGVMEAINKGNWVLADLSLDDFQAPQKDLVEMVSRHRKLTRQLSAKIRECVGKLNDPPATFSAKFSEEHSEFSAYEQMATYFVAQLEHLNMSTSVGSEASASPAERLLHVSLPRKKGCEVMETAQAYRHIQKKRRKASKS